MNWTRGIVLLLCCSMVVGCGTFLDFGLPDGPHVYGGVGVSIDTLGRRSLIENPFIYLYSIIDIPLSLVMDTVCLPITLTIGSTKRDPKVVNDERRDAAIEDLTKKLLKALGEGDHKLAVLDFPKKGEREGMQNPTGTDLAERLRKALTDKVAAMIDADQIRQEIEDSGFTTVEDELAVRSIADELGATALVNGNFVTAEFGGLLKLTVSIRSGETGKEIFEETVEIKLEDEAK